jgi:soluble lytic murein transglycosylase-like protein
MRSRTAGVSLAGLLLIVIACATQTRASSTTAPASEPEPVAKAPTSEQASAPEPAPMVEISAAAMEPVVAPPVEPPPFDEEMLAAIVAVQDIVATASSQHGVEPALINGVIWVESKFDPRAKGPGGSAGLMQLMPNTAKAMAERLGRKRASYDPDFNIHAGTLLLSRLLERFAGDVSLALAAYNRGSGVVAGWVASGEPMPERTQAYVDRVLEARGWFEQPLPAASQ